MMETITFISSPAGNKFSLIKEVIPFHFGREIPYVQLELISVSIQSK